MKTKQFPHGTAFEHQFTVTLRGEVTGRPLGCGCAEHERAHLEHTLRDAVRDAVARFYQCQLLGAEVAVTFPPAPLTTDH